MCIEINNFQINIRNNEYKNKHEKNMWIVLFLFMKVITRV